MRRPILLSAVLLFGMFAAQARAAEVHVSVNIGTPAPILVREAPRMVYLAEPAAYVAVGIPYDLYYMSGRYYYFDRGNWFWGPGYGGPWNVVVYKSLPPGLRKFNVARLHHFREVEYRSYRDSGHGRYFDADYGSHGNSRGRGRGHGNH